jgi:hypothetical protein
VIQTYRDGSLHVRGWALARGKTRELVVTVAATRYHKMAI